MYRIYITLMEVMAAAVFIIPLWMIYHKICFHSWKRTMIYMVFAFYMTAVLALVGFPNITLLKIEVTVNVIPFIYMIPDFANACLFANFMGEIPKCKKHYCGRIVDDPFY